MKKITFILLLSLLCKITTAHEDTYEAIELSNLHIKVKVGFESSYQLDIIQAYSNLINDFIFRIDSTKKVFIQFDEDYCLLNYNYYLLSYGLFKSSLIPEGFPFSYPYKMGYISKDSGLNIILSQKTFKLKPILHLIEFGLKNYKQICKIQKPYKPDASHVNPRIKYHMIKDFNGRIKSMNKNIIDSIINIKSTSLVREYLSKRIYLPDLDQVLKKNNTKLFLMQDSVQLYDFNDKKFLSISNLIRLSYEPETESMFYFDSDNTFFYVDKNQKTTQKQYKLSFSINSICEIIISVTYSKKDDYYLLSSEQKYLNEVELKKAYFKPKKGIINDIK